MVTFENAGAMIKFLSHGRVLAMTPAYDANDASVKANILLEQFDQYDSVLITPVGSEHICKEARKAMREAYKAGQLH